MPVLYKSMTLWVIWLLWYEGDRTFEYLYLKIKITTTNLFDSNSATASSTNLITQWPLRKDIRRSRGITLIIASLTRGRPSSFVTKFNQRCIKSSLQIKEHEAVRTWYDFPIFKTCRKGQKGRNGFSIFLHTIFEINRSVKGIWWTRWSKSRILLTFF